MSAFNREGHYFTDLFVSGYVTRHLSCGCFDLDVHFVLVTRLPPLSTSPPLRLLTRQRISPTPTTRVSRVPTTRVSRVLRQSKDPRRRIPPPSTRNIRSTYCNDHVFNSSPLKQSRRNVDRQHHNVSRIFQVISGAPRHGLRLNPPSASARNQDHIPTADHPPPPLAQTLPASIERIC